MKGLLIKDFYTLIKQMKIMIVMIIIFVCLPGASFSAFAVMYASLLPVTALAYDERSKWSSLAAMMPYSTRDIVASKYILGYFFIFSTTVLSFLAHIITNVVQGMTPMSFDYMSIIFMSLLGTLMLSISFPLMFRIGVEKGRLVFIILIVIMVSIITFLQGFFTERFGNFTMIKPLYLLIVAVVIIALNILSIFLSEKLYRNK
jgi:ABC-2 type transport system permease protein